MPLFALDRVTCGYLPHQPVFEGMSLEIREGEKICILGANGSGKSTLLKLLCGLLFPSGGSFRAFGREINERYLEQEAAAKEYHRRVGFVFQNSEVQLFNTRVWDEIAFGPRQLGLGEEEVKRRVEDVMRMLDISHLGERSPYRLSGGEKKKVAVASVLVLNPSVLLLDELTSGLDPKTQRWLVELLLALHRQGRTIITATHDLQLAHAISDRTVVLSEQHQLVYDGPSQEALENRELLLAVNLIGEYQHQHGREKHVHRQVHG